MKSTSIAALVMAAFGVLVARAQQPTATNLGNDANGNPLRRALKTGHVSNYDETKVRPYTLPDPLVLADGTPVRDAKTWQERRRDEIFRLYETEIYGRTPANAPRVTWRVAETDANAREGTAILKRLEGTIGDRAGAPVINVKLYTPAKSRGPVPVILLVNFGGGNTPPPGRAGAPPPSGDPPVASDIIAKGWGYATVGYQDIQPDRADAWSSGVIGATVAKSGSAAKPAPEEWGTISAWAWGVSRIIDYLERDKAVDAKQIALFGHSRLGKTALWAS